MKLNKVKTENDVCEIFKYGYYKNKKIIFTKYKKDE